MFEINTHSICIYTLIILHRKFQENYLLPNKHGMHIVFDKKILPTCFSPKEIKTISQPKMLLYNIMYFLQKDDIMLELVSMELNHLAAILHVYAGGLNFMK